MWHHCGCAGIDGCEVLDVVHIWLNYSLRGNISCSLWLIVLSNHPYMVNKSRYIRYEAREWGFGVRRSNAVLNRAFGSAWDAERERERPVRFGRTPFERPCRTEPTHLYSHWLLQIYMSLKPFQISWIYIQRYTRVHNNLGQTKVPWRSLPLIIIVQSFASCHAISESKKVVRESCQIFAHFHI